MTILRYCRSRPLRAGMNLARIFFFGGGIVSFCIVSCHFASFLRRFASFRVVFALFCIVLHCVEWKSNTLHCITTTFVVLFWYLDEIYIDLLNSCDFLFTPTNFASPLPPPKFSFGGGAPAPPYKYIPALGYGKT